jgi:EmrB/QacA subfamily drug resistance transporter
MAGPSPASSAAAPGAPATPAPPTREQRLILTIAILATFVAFLDGTVVNVALPAILKEFGGGIALQQWVVDAYLITLGALILVAGSVSDLYGRLRVLRVGIIGFGIASLAVGLAPTGAVLIAARLLQGAAGALLVPSSLALIMSNYRGAAQARAIGVWTSATSSAMIVGPILGGLSVDLATWRLAFVINVLPIAGVLWLLTRLEQRDVRVAGTHIDAWGAALCALGLGAAVYALIEAPTRGWSDAGIWVPAGAGVALLVAFVWRQRGAAAPMMPLALFRVRNFAWGNVATALIYGALALVSFLIGVYLQEGPGLTATEAGLAQLPIVFMMILLSPRVGGLAGRIGPRFFMTTGPLIMAAGTLLFLTVARDFSYWAQVLPGILVFGVGLALTVSPLTSAILGAIDTARSGIASAINNAVSRIAGLVMIALLGAIVGGQLNLGGFHRALVFTAALLALGGVVSFVGIRNARAAEGKPTNTSP